MQEFLDIALAYPTIVYTVGLGLTVAYWLLVIIGLFDLEFLDLDLELDVDVDLDMDVDADVDADIDVDGAVSGPGFFLQVLHLLGVGRVPLTIILSFTLLFGWALAYLGSAFIPGAMESKLVGALILAGAFLGALPMTSVVVYPLKRVFKTDRKHGGKHLVGQVAVVMTGSVDARFGQARVEDGGAGLLIHVRCETPNSLRKGSKALIIGYDDGANSYELEPMDVLLETDAELEEGELVQEVRVERETT